MAEKELKTKAQKGKRNPSAPPSVEPSTNKKLRSEIIAVTGKQLSDLVLHIKMMKSQAAEAQAISHNATLAAHESWSEANQALGLLGVFDSSDDEAKEDAHKAEQIAAKTDAASDSSASGSASFVSGSASASSPAGPLLLNRKNSPPRHQCTEDQRLSVIAHTDPKCELTDYVLQDHAPILSMGKYSTLMGIFNTFEEYGKAVDDPGCQEAVKILKHVAISFGVPAAAFPAPLKEPAQATAAALPSALPAKEAIASTSLVLEKKKEKEKENAITAAAPTSEATATAAAATIPKQCAMCVRQAQQYHSMCRDCEENKSNGKKPDQMPRCRVCYNATSALSGGNNGSAGRCCDCRSKVRY